MVKLIPALIDVSKPHGDPAKWYSSADEGPGFVWSNCRSDAIILYTNVGSTLIWTALAPLENLSPPDFADLQRADMYSESALNIEHSSGGGRPDQVYLAKPFSDDGSKSLIGGEPLIFRRSFSGVDKGKTRTELSQRLIHALSLYWLDEYKGYCQLDEQGDVQAVIKIIDLEQQSGRAGDVAVTIDSEHLHRFMAAAGMGLITRFDFTRTGGSFVGWSDQVRDTQQGTDLFFNSGCQGQSSYANGVHILVPNITRDDLIAKNNGRWKREGKQYQTFIAHDWKNGITKEISCLPMALSSYFEKDSLLPFQVTPAFFRPEVLQKYKADPEKYQLEHRALHSRAGWELRTFDVNAVGQVHTYLCYLADLPYSEQTYWKAFNEEPKGPLSERSIRTDFEGNFDIALDPLRELQSEVASLDNKGREWWSVRGESVRDSVHYPLTTSPEEWSTAILNLDQMLVEGFLSKPIFDRLGRLGRVAEPKWQSLRLLQDLLEAKGETAAGAASVMEPLKQLHFLRSKVKGHAAVSAKTEIIKKARSDYGSLKDHFVDLIQKCEASFHPIIGALDAPD